MAQDHTVLFRECILPHSMHRCTDERLGRCAALPQHACSHPAPTQPIWGPMYSLGLESCVLSVCLS